jgi:hypothetical protein
MGYDRHRFNTGTKVVRVESGKLILPSEVGAQILNFEDTSEGTLAGVRGPAPMLPDYGSGYFSYGTPHGVLHALLQAGNRDVLLAHTGGHVRVFEGWNRTWSSLIGPTGSQIVTTLPDDEQPRYPTQFEVTPTGIVIVPQGHDRAYFYDGTICLPLGYDKAPGAPVGYGPEDGSGGPNTEGYYSSFYGGGIAFIHHPDFGRGRVGTVQSDVTGSLAGCLLPAAYQMAYQWIDIFGNLSPLSGRSNTVSFSREDVDAADNLDDVLKAILWDNIEPGPTGTIGRPCARTKDMKNSGTTALFEMPGNFLGATSGSFATIPDNAARKYPDNTADVQLVTRPPDIVPVPTFKLCRMAFERLWITGIESDPAALRASLPGRWGTFGDVLIYPDPNGGEPTGLWMTAQGLIVTTITSTFLVTPNVDGDGFRVDTLSSTRGGIAPDSFKTLPDGSTIWLSRDGFTMLDAENGVRPISEDIRDSIERIPVGRMLQATAAVDPRTREYRCWVPFDGSVGNHRCFIYSYLTQGWRERDGENLRGVCVTRDHRNLMIGAGKVTDGAGTTRSGVWILDHEVKSFSPPTRTYAIETSWIEGLRSAERKSAKHLHVWLRETVKGAARVQAWTDWRKSGTPSYEDNETCLLYTEEDIPALWGVTRYGSNEEPNEWVRRRPFWRKVSVYLPSCEVYKLRIESESPIEFLGLSFDEQPQPGSGRMLEARPR